MGELIEKEQSKNNNKIDINLIFKYKELGLELENIRKQNNFSDRLRNYIWQFKSISDDRLYFDIIKNFLKTNDIDIYNKLQNEINKIELSFSYFADKINNK